MAPSSAARLSLNPALGQQVMLSFLGEEIPSPEFLNAVHNGQAGGVVLFREDNIASPAQLRRLTEQIQQAARESGQPPLLIAIDQEGGQLISVGEPAMQLPGNMALGAAGDESLAYRAGQATGLELNAMGVNVNFAPVCDVNNNPANPLVGVRSFGEDPALVARLASAFIQGSQSAGVAACAKHFPGHGDSSGDSHYLTPVLLHDAERLQRIELPPFSAAIQAGVRMVMSAHVALPALNDGSSIPATLSPRIMKGLLRSELGFEGVIISDAMDMHAIIQGEGLAGQAVAALQAGVDMLILNVEDSLRRRVFDRLVEAINSGALDKTEIQSAARRILELKGWLSQQKQTGLEVVGSPEHQSLAQEISHRALTLVRDQDYLLPLHLNGGSRLGVVLPRPENLTPADSSAYERLSMAPYLQRYWQDVDEIIIPLRPSPSDIGAAVERMRGCAAILVGTINAQHHTGQAELARRLIASGTPVIAVGLRLPYDLAAYPAASTYICTYSIQSASLEALADGLFGELPFPGKLPVTIPLEKE